MKNNAKRLLFYFFIAAMIPVMGFSKSTDPVQNVSNYSRVPAMGDTTPFQYGVNPGYYGNGWTDTALAGIATRAGSHSMRTSLADQFVEKWGYNIRINEYNYYKNTLGMKAITLFIGEPSDAHVDKTIFPPATKHSSVFANLYTPIWDNGENGTPVNDNNYFALYVYKLVQTYGSFIKYWEVVNEPDFSYYWDNGNINNPSNWYNNSPSPEDLPNLRAPIYYYIRMLRVANEVIKKYNPDSYVAPGGLGYPAFLDAMLRYTDNPDGGKVTPAYPSKGGAYFDVVSYHVYPANNLSVWDNSIGGFRWFRHTDRAVEEIYKLKNDFINVLSKYGYNGTTHPAKTFILTEVNLPRKMFGDHYGGEEAQRNFMIKAAVTAQKNGIEQFYVYQLSETANYDQNTGSYDYMGLYENLKRDTRGNEKLTSEGKALKTTSLLLYGWRYDPVRTQALNIPGNIEGLAFKNGDKYRYVLWARTTTDMSEAANATYSFPPSLGLDSLNRFEWDYSIKPSSKSKCRFQNISLNGTPSFFESIDGGFGVLAVNILSFNAHRSDCNAIIDWNVAFDEPGNKLNIEESENGEDFSQIYSTELTGKNQIGSFKHEMNSSGVKMYRLVIENADGTKSYSKIRTIESNCNEGSAQIMAFPNPAKDDITVSGLSEDQVITVYDNFGRKARILNVPSKGNMKIDLSNFASSYYYLSVSDSKGNTIKTIKFLKK